MKSLVIIASFFASTLGIAQSAAQIKWPEAYRPENASFFVQNEIRIDASPEDVWSVLIAAEEWPSWYNGATDVDVKDGALLDSAVIFSWKTMGLRFISTIREFKPHERLAWESSKRSIRGYHAWLIIPDGNGVKLITEEAQHGWLTTMEKIFQPRKLKRLHDVWLARIKERAENRSRNER